MSGSFRPPSDARHVNQESRLRTFGNERRETPHADRRHIIQLAGSLRVVVVFPV
jgi:hypothetical protein